MSPSDITNKLWNYCHVLRDDGISYGDYVEQFTYLLFLKMADERTQAPYNQPSIVPQQYSWSLALTPALSLRERGEYLWWRWAVRPVLRRARSCARSETRLSAPASGVRRIDRRKGLT